MTQTSTQSSGSKTNVGAIAGGVVGGVAFIAIITFVIWRYCIRPRYNYPEDDSSEEFNQYQDQEKSPDQFTPTEKARNSTPSVRSVASTVMTRASNIIQIAFIPGITDRQGHNDDSVPPVPRIPENQRNTISSTHSRATGHAGTPDHFFHPADLAATGSRWSQFSNTTTDSEDVRSTRHQSLASSLARESVASAIFQDHQATPMSASQGVRGKANVVSVKPSATTTPNSASHIPEVPAVDYFKYAEHKKKVSDGNDQASSGTTLRPTIVEPTPIGSSASASGSDPPSSVKENGLDGKKPSPKMLAAAIEDATRRASRQPVHGGLGSVGPKQGGQSSQLAQPGSSAQGGLRERDPSPFSDSNAVHTP